MREVFVQPQSLFARESKRFRSDFMGPEPWRFIEIGQMMDALNFKMGTGWFVVIGI